MAGTKISQLDAAGALIGTEASPIVQGGTTVRTTLKAIADLEKEEIVNNLTTGGADKFASAETVKTLNTNKVATTRQVIAGAGLTGGGDFSSDKTISVVSADDGIKVNADDIKLNIINDLVTSSATRPISATQAKLLYDSYLESLPTVGIAVQQSGDGSASTTINIYTLVATTATITGGTFSGGLTTMAIPARTNTAVVFSLSSTEGLISIKGLSKINSVTTTTNAPIFVREAVWVLPSVMTYFSCIGSNTLSGVLSLPSVMTYFACTGNNTLSGILSLPSVMTHFSCTGSNTLSGVLSLPSVMTHFSCTGSNTLSGVLSLPSVMTHFVCIGSNTLSGVLSLPSVMTYFVCGGSNTLSGVLSLPSVMTHFVCGGSNTLSGVLSLPPVMTYFSCYGSNTLSGVLSLPSVMTYFVCGGSNTITYPTVGTNVFATTFNRFYISPQSTWTSAMTDAVLIDAAATITTAIGEKQIDIRGNAGARTSASDSAKAYLESIGFTIFTN